MLIADNMLQWLAEEEENESSKDCDDDLGAVLDFCETDVIKCGHTLLYSDGQKRNFSFDK